MDECDAINTSWTDPISFVNELQEIGSSIDVLAGLPPNLRRRNLFA
jgi:hypothetical protein